MRLELWHETLVFRRVLPFRYTGRDPSTCVDASAVSALVVVANVVCAATSGCMMFMRCIRVKVSACPD